MERKIEFIVVHCTASTTDAKISDLQNYWQHHLGWKRPGYHFVIHRDGYITQVAKESEITNGVKGYNAHAIHISYIGGIDKDKKPIDNRTPQQQDAMFDKIIELSEKYPEAEIKGHRDFPDVHKACPCFDVRTWLSFYEPEIDKAA